MEGAYARLEGRNFEFYMNKRRVTIGRNSKLGDVDVNMGSSRFISRKHLEITIDRNCFFILCRGKNGVFVDDVFQRRENRRIQLPSQCIIRFPSTQIKLAFTSLWEEMGPPQSFPSTSPAHPLKIDTMLTSPFVSPMPSPTGTISAVNSCPASPNSEYRRKMPSFDFMAKYASKLLSSTASDSEGPSETSNTAEEEGDDNEVASLPPPTHPETLDYTSSDHGGNEKEEELDEGKMVEKSHLKPPYSYAQLIVQALLASRDRRQTLSNIYQFIAERYPFYKLEDKGWKNSIRHNLSLNQYFMKAPREKEGLGFGKGGYWCMHPDYEDKLTSQAYVKRKKKGIPVFPSAGLITRSAPPSPTHHPILPTELNPRELEAKFAMPNPPTTTHFALPSFFSQLPSSHSLPASPSRPHSSSFTATPLKFFPAPLHSSSTEALALERPRKIICEPIKEGHEDIPPSKKPRLEREGEGTAEGHSGTTRPIQLPTITSLPAVQFSQPSAVQFLSIPLMTSAGPQPSQAIFNQPLSSFLPQHFFSHRSQRQASHSTLPPSQDGHSSCNDEG